MLYTIGRASNQERPMVCSECGVEHPNLREYAGDNYCPTCFTEYIAECAQCGVLFDRDDVVERAGEFYCQPCYDREYRRCYRCGHEVIAEGAQTQNAHVYCESCFDRHFFRCYHCDGSYSRDCQHRNPRGRPCCPDCFRDHYRCCEGCGDVYDLERMRDTDSGYYCPDCEGPHNEWELGTFSGIAEHTVMQSTRNYGIEIETSRCDNFENLRGHTIWGCKPDCSISGLEFISPIMYGDAGLKEITRFCKQGRDKGWRTNSECGLHVHLDARDMTPKQLRSVALAYFKTFELWRRLVEPRRSENAMCGSPKYNAGDITGIDARGASDWDYFVGAQDRFEFVNWRAYLVHGSIEIRLHHGTLDGVEICNWTRVHAKFIDAVANMSLAAITTIFDRSYSGQFAALAKVIGKDLADYYTAKADSYDTPVLAPPVPSFQIPGSTARVPTLGRLEQARARALNRLITQPGRVIIDNSEVMDRARDWMLRDVETVANSGVVHRDSGNQPQTHDMTWHVTPVDENA